MAIMNSSVETWGTNAKYAGSRGSRLGAEFRVFVCTETESRAEEIRFGGGVMLSLCSLPFGGEAESCS